MFSLTKLFYVCVGALALGQLGNLSRTDGVAIYLFDICIVVFVVYGLVTFRRKLQLPAVSLLFLTFSFWILVSNVINLPKYPSDISVTATFYFLRWLAYLLAAVVVYNMCMHGQLTKEHIYTSMLVSAVFLVVAGVAQLILIPDFEKAALTDVGWDPHKNRLASTFLDPNYLGAYLTIAIFMLLNKLIDKKMTTKDYALLGMFFIALILTFSRSAWLMFGVGVLLYGLLKKPLWVVYSLVVAFLAYFAVPRVQTRISGVTDPADSAQFRLVSWKNALRIYQDNPIVGTGFNVYRYVQQDYGYLTPDTVSSHSGAGADSSVLFVLATTGTMGGLLFSAGILYLVFGMYSLVPFVLMGSLILESMFINSLFYPQILFWWLVVGFIPRVSRKQL